MWGIGGAVALLLLNKFLSGQVVAGAAGALAQVPGDVVRGTISGITGLPDPATAASQSACDAALAAGDDWKASFYCPASRWAKGLFDGK